MALEFKIEWFRDEKRPTQAGAFIHLTKELSCFQDLITKEEAALINCQTEAILEENPDAFDAEAQCSQICELANKMFEIEGVVEVSLRSYQVFVVKAELFNWDDIIPEVLDLLLEDTGETVLFEKIGSRLTLENPTSRRSLGTPNPSSII